MQIKVQGKAGECGFSCGDDETLLLAGLRQGLSLPYECATGTCGSCRGRLMEGDVALVWNDAPALAKLKRDKGDILLCQARPKSDCTVRIPAHVATKAGANDLPTHRKGRIANLQLLTRDVIHFELLLSAPISFKPGQFVVVEAKDVPGRRAYSIVNYQTNAQTIALLVKRKPGGGFSNWLFEQNVEGQELEVFGPLGQATFAAEEGKDIICIAGGSGIAGMMSILECATSQSYFRDHKGYVFFGVRSVSDAFYVDELARYVDAAKGGLEVTIAFSDEDISFVQNGSFRGLNLVGGMVHEVAERAMEDRYGDLISYVAGPVPMVDGAIRMLVTQAGLTPDKIRFDKFS